MLFSISDVFLGVSLGVHEKFKHRYLATIAVSVLLCAFIGLFIEEFLNNVIPFNLSIVMGALFVLLGIKDLFDHRNKKTTQSALRKTVLLGIILSIDCAISTAGLAANLETTSLWAPLLTAFFIMAFTAVGNISVKYIKIPSKILHFISGSCLIIVGTLVMVGVL